MTNVPPPAPPEGPPPPSQAYPPPPAAHQQPYPPSPYGYPPPGHYPYPPPPRRSNKGLIALLVLLGVTAIAAGLIFLTPVGQFFFGSGFMVSPEERERMNADVTTEQGAILNDRYLDNSGNWWCDSRGGRMRFQYVAGEVSFYRNNRPDSLISTTRYSLSGSRLTIATASGVPMVADLVRIDARTMMMTIRGQTETLRHCV